MPVGRWTYRLRWVAVPQDYEEGGFFSDVQGSGPFGEWKQTHTFEPDDSAACLLGENPECALPFDSMGGCVAGR
jgi:ligand-binding SRPBCC domain-containing protein